MLTLVTSNAAKFRPFASELERLRIVIESPAAPLPEIQSLSFIETLTAKARAAAAQFGRPVLVDDTGLILEAYPTFPGPLTSLVLRSLGVPGLTRLLSGTSDRATMQCHLGCWVEGGLRSWAGTVAGRIDLSRTPRDDRMPLTDLFVPDPVEAEARKNHQPEEEDSTGRQPLWLHRGRALAALAADGFKLHLETSAREIANAGAGASRAGYDCPFCAEFEGDGPGIYGSLLGSRLPSRVLYEDDDFIVMPPLGEFMEGGLLLLTRKHILSFAHLPPGKFEKLERLLKVVGQELVRRWGVAPLVFEHGPAGDSGKGVCCVDHAHLNIFPAAVSIHPHLAERMNFAIGPLSELAQLKPAEFGYLLVQENDGMRRVYDSQNVPTQLVRRIIATHRGQPERWHWRDYVGDNELIATFGALQGRIRL
jgi:inosine/xanthosine triphosphate pyrophosphatase family protein/diadenosine tetraphosphate (Ap4A) HIT family hydrolase